MAKKRSALIIGLLVIVLIAMVYYGYVNGLLATGVEKGDMAAVGLALRCGANVNSRYKGAPMICLAASRNNALMVNYLLTHGARVNEKDSADYCTALHIGAAEGNVDIVKTLISRGADVNARDHSNRTPLVSAAREGRGDIVTLLMKSGAKPTPYSGCKFTVDLDFASYYALSVSASEALIINGALTDIPIIDDTIGDNVKSVKALLKSDPGLAHARVACSQGRWTALHWACFLGHLEAALLLIQSGADVNAKDASQRTPLHLAAVNANEEIMTTLLLKGAKASERDDGGGTPLNYAIKYGNARAVKTLIERQECADDIELAIRQAKQSGHKEIIEMLERRKHAPVQSSFAIPSE